MLLKRLQRWSNWNSATAQRQRRKVNARQTRQQPNGFRPALEALEDRTMLTTHLALVGTQTLVPSANVDASNNKTTNESEMQVDINPTNPLNVVGFVHDTSNLNQIQVFFSIDGGNNWKRRLITNTAGVGSINDGFGIGQRYDPNIKFDANGTLYVAYGINYSTQLPDGTYTTANTRLVVGASTDGGSTFPRFTQVDLQNNVPVAPIKGVPQPPEVGVDHWEIATGPSGPNTTLQAIYIAYVRFQATQGMMIAGSRNGGANFTAPLAFNNANDVGQDAFPGVGPNGELYVSWDSGTRILSNRDLGGLWSNTTFGTDVTVRNLNRTLDLRTFKPPAQPTRGFGNSPVLDVDRTGSGGSGHNGRVYVAFVDGFNLPTQATYTDIYLVWSDDQGAHWTSPPPGGGNVASSSATNFLPSVAVDQDTGSVNVAYYTTDGAPNNTQVNLRLASSRDGGNTFRRADVTTQRSRASSMSYTGQFLEYIGLAVRDGTAQAFWCDNRGPTQGSFITDADSYSARVASVSNANTLTVHADNGGAANNEVVTLRSDPVNKSFAQVIINGKTDWEGLWASVGQVFIYANNANDTFNIENLPSGVSLTFAGGGSTNTVNLSPVAHDLSNIAGQVALNSGPGKDNLVINDDKYGFSAVYSIFYKDVVRQGLTSTSGSILYSGFANGVVINGGSASDRYDVSSSPVAPMTINTGLGVDTVNVLATSGPVTVNGQSGDDFVHVGNKGNTQGIGGPLTITNASGFSTVDVDDSADTSARQVILYNNGTYNVLSGMTPGGDVLLQGRHLKTLTISAGSSIVNGVIVGGNIFRIHDTPNNNTPGGVQTTVNTGAGPDNVTIDGTTGGLDLDVQGAGAGANVISVGSATANLDRINGPINITGDAGAFNSLSIIDGAANVFRDYVLGSNSVQRLDKARIGYQNMSNLTVQTIGRVTAGQLDRITVQDTAVFEIGQHTDILVGGGGDEIDVSKTTGVLLISAGGSSMINVGSDTSSLDDIQGAISVQPSAGSLVTLNLNDQAATTTQQLDIAPEAHGFNATTFRRSGSAGINVLFSPLAAFSWFGGSGGNTVNVKALPAPQSTFTLGSGGDMVNLGTTANQLFKTGLMHIVGGAGADQLLLRDDGTTTPQRYDVGNFPIVGRETLGVITAHPLSSNTPLFKVFFEFVESVTLNGGSGGNFVKVGGTPMATSVQIHTGAGDDSVVVASNMVPASLSDMRGPLMLDGQGGVNNQVTFNDSGATTRRNYSLGVAQFVWSDSGIVAPPVTFSNFKTITLDAGAGGNDIEVPGTAAGTNVVINGSTGPEFELIELFADNNALLGPVALHIQPGAFDLVQYFDSDNPTPQTYTFTNNTISRSGQADVTYDGAFVGAFAIELFEPTVGGNKTYVQSVAAGSEERSFNSNGDQVTVGSLAPKTGGDLHAIQGFVGVTASDPNAHVALLIDDSGNMDTTSQHVVFPPVRDADGFINMLGLAPGSTPLGWNLPPTSSVKILGGAADETFSMHPIVAETPLTLVGGTGVNTLDYSAYTTDVTVNLATGVATDLAGISNFRNVIGGSGNDTLTGSALGGVLMGGAGNDVLTGGAGRNILVGGSGKDTINGGNAGDIIIGGLLSYYDEATRTVDTVALDALLAEWSRTDLSYQDRVNHLNGSVAGGFNGPYVLNNTTVFDDGVMDAIFAGAGQNWVLNS
jgi:hypothetical protein